MGTSGAFYSTTNQNWALAETDWLDDVRRIAGRWRLPVDWIAAAMWPAAERGAPVAQNAAPEADPIVQTHAAAYSNWRATMLPAATTEPYSTRLRELLRAIYCDEADFRHVLMWLIERDAALFAASDDQLAAETLAVAVPLAEALGLWWLRRRWIEESARQLQPEAYEQAARSLGLPALATSDGLEERLVAMQASWIAASDVDPDLQTEPALDPNGQLRLFSHLRAALHNAFSVAFAPPLPIIELLPSLPGAGLLQRVPGDDLALEQPPQLAVRILCGSEADCYRALGVVYSVAQLVRAGDTHRWRNYMALPLPNGYRALQTVCLWPLQPSSGQERRLIKFHILTWEMHTLNEWGAIEAARNPQGEAAAMWQLKRAQLADHLHRRYRRPEQEDVGAFLRTHPPGSQSNPVYCFTPIGELHFLEPGSTALDFAYRVHTQIGHHATRITVNGRDVPFSHPLANGDLVQVTYDPLLTQLDFSWQSMVRTRGARSKVRAALRRRAAGVHPGRLAFEAELMRRLDAYRQNGQQSQEADAIIDLAQPPSLELTTEQVERFLERAALRGGYESVDTLYDRLATTVALVQDLAHQLLSEHLIPALVTTAAIPLRPEYARIELCPVCQPNTGDRIRGRVRPRPEGSALIIHAVRSERRPCNFGPRGGKEIDLVWAPNEPERWPRYRFTVDTTDGFRVLDRLLEMVYELAGGAYLYRVDASVDRAEGRAHVIMDVNVRLPQFCRDLQLRMLNMGEATSAVYDLIPGDEPPHLYVSEPSREVMIPFTTGIVTDWRFVNRDEMVVAIKQWLTQREASPVLLLYGQRRVGKSSLVTRMIERNRLEELEPQPVVPVLLDFRTPSLLRPASVAQYMVQTIYRSLDIPLSRLPDAADPFVWLNERLDAAVDHLRGKRLLLVIDEFDAELGNADVEPPVMRNLGPLLQSRRPINWLLIVRDAFLADPRLRRLLSTFPFGVPQLPVRPLDADYARRLVTALLERRDFRFATPDLPDRIVAETGGIPYLIHVIGRHLMEWAQRTRREVISSQDLNKALNLTLDVEGNFSHLTEYLLPATPRRAIAAFVAGNTQPGKRLPLSFLEEELVRQRNWLSSRALEQHLIFLDLVGVLDLAGKQDSRSVGIPLWLLHRWIANNIHRGES